LNSLDPDAGPLPIACPFCASVGERLVVTDDTVQCFECGAAGPECDKRGKGFVAPHASVEAWNRRPTPTAPAKRSRNISRVSYNWLLDFERDGKLALWPEVQSMARELLERRAEERGK
jgi:hypothetical protein